MSTNHHPTAAARSSDNRAFASSPCDGLTTQIREALDTAKQAGQPPPGRPTLVRLTGATDHAVRKALAQLATEPANAGEPHVDEVSEKRSAGVRACTPSPPGGRLVAWAGFIFGSVMSIAANVLHAWLPAEHQPPGWSPGIGAAVWPLGLMLAVEALSRIRWPRGFLWSLARYGGAGTVALGSAVISYGHLRDVLLAWHYDPLAAAVGPLVLDGLMVVCGFALLANSLTTAGDASTTTTR